MHVSEYLSQTIDLINLKWINCTPNNYAILNPYQIGGINMSNIGTIMKKIRESKKISRAELAKKINVSYSALQHWENNERDINIYNLSVLPKELNTEVHIKNNLNIEVFNKDLNKVYNLNLNKGLGVNAVYEIGDYIVVLDDVKEDTYKIKHKHTLTTPYQLELTYYSLDEAKKALNDFLIKIKFPVINKNTINTGGKIIFIEQIYLILKDIGVENGFEIVRSIIKKQSNDGVLTIKTACENKYGPVDGLELADLILEAIPRSYKRVLFNDYVRGYTGFLSSITNNTQGVLKSVHQKHAFLRLIDIHNEHPIDHFIGGYTEYNKAIKNVINRDIFKYGYPEFFEKVKAAIGE